MEIISDRAGAGRSGSRVMQRYRGDKKLRLRSCLIGSRQLGLQVWSRFNAARKLQHWRKINTTEAIILNILDIF